MLYFIFLSGIYEYCNNNVVNRVFTHSDKISFLEEWKIRMICVCVCVYVCVCVCVLLCFVLFCFVRLFIYLFIILIYIFFCFICSNLFSFLQEHICCILIRIALACFIKMKYSSGLKVIKSF